MQYHKHVHPLAQRLAHSIREQELLRAGDRVGAAVSGGADSVALLRLLLELREQLGMVLFVLHVNHQIRGAEADADQEFVSELAAKHNLLLHAFSGDTPAYAAAHHLSLEAAAREVRYQYFQRLLVEGILDKVATAHTLDDQAETILLRLARGTGITGLAGIYPKWAIANTRVGAGLGPAQGERVGTGLRPVQGERSSPAAIVRPLLHLRRRELQDYLQALAQPWREDASNLDLRFTRNRVRHKLLPLLEAELNPRICELLAETAEIARAEEDYWAAQIFHAQCLKPSGESAQPSLSIAVLNQLPLALQRRVLRAAALSQGLHLEFQHVEEVLALAKSSEAGDKQLMVPGGWRVIRTRKLLRFEPPSPVEANGLGGFEYPLSCPGEVAVAETGTVFLARLGPISRDAAVTAYDPTRLPRWLRVRNWRPGDRFWPGHTRARKKLKELLQERKIPLAQRRHWPVITSMGTVEEEIIWVRGFPPPQHLLATSGQHQGLTIEEHALQKPALRAE